MLQTLLPATALLVITTLSPIVSVLALVLFTTIMATILFSQGFTFVGLLYIVVYVGAVAILFIFVIMMIDVREAEIFNVGKAWTKILPVTFFIVGLALLTISLDFTPIQFTNYNNAHQLLSETQSIAQAFYGFSAFHLVIVALLLLTAMIGPIALCLFSTRQNHP